MKGGVFDMEYVIYPYSGFFCVSSNARIEFDMTSTKIASLLGYDKKETMSNLDYFDHFRVDYDDKGYAVAFEFFNTSKLLIDENNNKDLPSNIDLFTLKFKELNKIILKIDNTTKCDGAGVISLKLGIGTYHEDSDDDKCESIIIFKKGYYDSLGW